MQRFLLTCALTASSAYARVQLTGGGWPAAGSPRANAILYGQLSQSDTSINDSSHVLPLPIDSSGSMVSELYVWSNDNLLRRGANCTFLENQSSLMMSGDSRVSDPSQERFTGDGPLNLINLSRRILTDLANVTFPGTATVTGSPGVGLGRWYRCASVASCSSIHESCKLNSNPPATTEENSLKVFNLDGTEILDRYACSAEGVALALTAIPKGGTIDSRGCRSIATASTIKLNVNNVTFKIGATTISGTGTINPVIGVTGNDVMIQCQGRSSVITSSYLGSSSAPTVSNLILLMGTGDELWTCTLEGQATSGADSYQVGVHITGNNAKVMDNFLTGTSETTGLQFGISVDGAKSTYVERNIIQQIQTPSRLTGQGIITGGGVSTGGFIRGNTVTFTGKNGAGDHQIYISQGSSQFEVSNNILTGGTGNLIKLFATDTQSPCQYNEVHDNSLTGGGNVGATGAIYITNNCTHNSIHDNFIMSYSLGPSIEVDGATVGKTPDSNTISSNHLYDPGTQCILVVGANRELIQGNDCRAPSRLSVGTYDAFKVQGDGGSNSASANIFSGNLLAGTGYRASLNISSTPPVPSATVVSGNNFPKGGSFNILDSGTNTIYGANIVAGMPNNAPIQASLTTTSAMSDIVTVTGLTSSGHCSLIPTNTSAATHITTTYISAQTTDQITVTHKAATGMTYEILCTPN